MEKIKREMFTVIKKDPRIGNLSCAMCRCTIWYDRVLGFVEDYVIKNSEELCMKCGISPN